MTLNFAQYYFRIFEEFLVLKTNDDQPKIFHVLVANKIGVAT
jgi:hypothetical protein